MQGIFKSNLSHYWGVPMIRKRFLTLSWNFPPCSYQGGSLVFLSPCFRLCFPNPHNYVCPSGISSTIWRKLLCEHFRLYSIILNITTSLIPSAYTMVLQRSSAGWLTLLRLTPWFVNTPYKMRFPQFRTTLSRG